MVQTRSSNDQSLHCDILNLLPKQVRISPIGLDIFENSSQTSFVTDIVFFCIFVLNKVITVLVYSIVGKMHEHIVKIACVGRVILLSCKPPKSFFVNEESHWIKSIDQDIDS